MESPLGGGGKHPFSKSGLRLSYFIFNTIKNLNYIKSFCLNELNNECFILITRIEQLHREQIARKLTLWPLDVRRLSASFDNRKTVYPLPLAQLHMRLLCNIYTQTDDRLRGCILKDSILSFRINQRHKVNIFLLFGSISFNIIKFAEPNKLLKLTSYEIYTPPHPLSLSIPTLVSWWRLQL